MPGQEHEHELEHEGDVLVRGPSAGFPRGLTRISVLDGRNGIDFAILRLGRGERHTGDSGGAGQLGLERGWLLLGGEVVLHAADLPPQLVRRTSLFDEEPVVAHVPAGMPLAVEAATDAELALLAVRNEQYFVPQLLGGAGGILESELRGRGRLDDTAYRIVRTIFDLRNRPESRLVLGEVVAFPGRWSSYPPHHHPQPEIYHYRFSEPQGYGHAEAGEAVFKVRRGDTLLIPSGADHAQAAAPGYGMYYLWAIRHLPDRPYTVPEFSAEHRWLNEPEPAVWRAQLYPPPGGSSPEQAAAASERRR